MTDYELLIKWKEGEVEQKRLWREILTRGLYLAALGIDIKKRDNSWRIPVNYEGDPGKFFAGVRGAPHFSSKSSKSKFRKEKEVKAVARLASRLILNDMPD